MIISNNIISSKKINWKLNLINDIIVYQWMNIMEMSFLLKKYLKNALKFSQNNYQEKTVISLACCFSLTLFTMTLYKVIMGEKSMLLLFLLSLVILFLLFTKVFIPSWKSIKNNIGYISELKRNKIVKEKENFIKIAKNNNIKKKIIL